MTEAPEVQPLPPLTAGPSGPADLRGRVALVTGAARGIGRGIAEALAAAGAAVVVGDLLPGDETVAAMSAAGGRALAVRLDVTDPASVAAAVATAVATFGRLDILVNNAGVLERSALETLDLATLQREYDVIVKGTVLCTQAVYEVMKRQGGGKIVNIASISGKLGGAVSGRGGPGSGRSGPAYAAAKGGVIAFTKWVARDAGRSGIHVNAVCPGPVESEMTRGYHYDVAAQPIGRMGTPADVAQAALFFASQMSNFVTGQTLNVDGGILMD